MEMRAWAARVLPVFALAASLDAQTPRVTAIRIPPEGGALFATVGGQEKKVAPAAEKAWLLDRGSVAYSVAGGAGGFENEGQSLFLYDPATGKGQRVVEEPFEITGVREALSATGKAALLVSMEDGGLGASHVAVVDPARGEVFKADGARFAHSGTGSTAVAWYKDEDWDRLRDKRDVKPVRTKTYDLDQLLRRTAAAARP